MHSSSNLSGGTSSLQKTLSSSVSITWHLPQIEHVVFPTRIGLIGLFSPGELFAELEAQIDTELFDQLMEPTFHLLNLKHYVIFYSYVATVFSLKLCSNKITLLLTKSWKEKPIQCTRKSKQMFCERHERKTISSETFTPFHYAIALSY